MDVQEADDLQWRIMDVCTDVEDGFIDHVTATQKILQIIKSMQKEAV